MSVRLDERPAWRALAAHHGEIGEHHLRALFAEDPARGERLVLDAAGLHLDYSKNRVCDETMRLLVDLARECGVDVESIGGAILYDETIRQQTNARRGRYDAARDAPAAN